MGARTVSRSNLSANQRRRINMIIEQIQRDTQWAVFEVNNPHLDDRFSRCSGSTRRVLEHWLAD